MDHLARLVEHLAWADRRVLEALRAAAPTEGGALETFAHILAAEHVWHARLVGEEPTIPVWPALTIDQCATVAAENVERLRAFVATLRPEDANRQIRYTNSAGQSFSTAIEDILLHTCLHGGYHRGQIAATLRAAGHEPAPTDYIRYLREGPR